VFRWSTESAQRLLELQSGTVDAIDNPGPDDFEKIQADPTLAFYKREGFNIFYVGFNNNPTAEGWDNSTNPLANEKVRQAIAMGIDRQRIVDEFYLRDLKSPSTSRRAPSQRLRWRSLVYIRCGCRQGLLTEAGYPDGFDTVLNYRDVVRAYLPIRMWWLRTSRLNSRIT